MCGIIGLPNFSQIKLALKLLKHRGKDNFGVSNLKETINKKQINSLKELKGNYFLGHTLHAIVEEIPQPLNNSFVANCEIYNWKELSIKYNLKAKNDADMLLRLIEKKGIKSLEETSGSFALAYIKDNKITFARDIMGIKPLFYTKEGYFSSERKVLHELKYNQVLELNPREIITIDKEKKNIKRIERKFFENKKETKETKKEIIKKLKLLIAKAIKKRIPKQKLGLLFSGGLDSTYLAMFLKKEKIPFTAYTAALEEPGLAKSKDLIAARKAKEMLNLNLKEVLIPLKEVPKNIKEIIPLIEDSHVVKVGVALPFYLACKKAKKDKIKVIFSGLGSEEIFAGYDRHKNALDINKECRAGLLQMYERDLYRDDVISMSQTIEIRLPFLDKELIEYALSIPSKYKITKEETKHILRETAREIGMPEEFAGRKKIAAQYGSKFDKAIEKLAKKEKKSVYLSQFLKRKKKLGVLFSSGKDSTFAAWLMQEQGYDLSCLITIKSKNAHSYMYHTPNIWIVKEQAKSMNLPLILQETKGEKEKELKELEIAIKKAKEDYNIEGIITGALYSRYQRDRVEKIVEKLGLKMFSPLWHINQEHEMRTIINAGFKFILVSVAAEGLDKTWLGRPITQEDIDKLSELNKKIGLNIAGEGGEFESLVIDGPSFKEPIKYKGKIEMESENTGFYILSKE